MADRIDRNLKGRKEQEAGRQSKRPVNRQRLQVQQKGRAPRERSASGNSRRPGSRKKFLLPLLLLAAVVVTVGIALAARLHTKAVKANAVADAGAAASTDLTLEKNAYPAVNELFRKYYDALVTGDTHTISLLSAELSDEEKIRIGEIAKYIESYPSIDVYTKPGPIEDSYVCYVVTIMKFKDHDWEVPGMQTMYVCTDDDGELYINNAHSQTQAVSDYIQTVSLQDDVVDLNNKVTADYNKLVADDADLSAFLNELSSNIDVSVGQALGELQSSAGDTEEAAEGASEAGTSSAEEGDTADGSSSGSSFSAGATILTATDVVNVRNAAGENADIIGTTIKGGQYELVEEDTASGWSEIVFNGTRGYVKTEYFTKSSQ